MTRPDKATGLHETVPSVAGGTGHLLAILSAVGTTIVRRTTESLPTGFSIPFSGPMRLLETQVPCPWFSMQGHKRRPIRKAHGAGVARDAPRDRLYGSWFPGNGWPGPWHSGSGMACRSQWWGPRRPSRPANPAQRAGPPLRASGWKICACVSAIRPAARQAAPMVQMRADSHEEAKPPDHHTVAVRMTGGATFQSPTARGRDDGSTALNVDPLVPPFGPASWVS